MPDLTFQSSRLKVERAIRHIHELQAGLAAFLKTEFYSLRIDIEPETRKHVLRLETVRRLPNEVPLVIGDAVHNLRSALDHIVATIVSDAGINDSRATFPMHEARHNLIDTVNKGSIKEAAPHIADIIINDIKPYKAGNFPIWALGKLDNLDKHKLLIPVLAVTELTDVRAEDDNYNTTFLNSIKVRGEGRIDITGFGVKARITDYGKPTFDILFDKGQLFDGKAIIPTLHQLTQLVLGIIEMIEAGYFVRPTA